MVHRRFFIPISGRNMLHTNHLLERDVKISMSDKASPTQMAARAEARDPRFAPA